LIDNSKIEYSLLDHEPCKTSEESAKVRGVSLDSGAKAMLIKELKQGVFFLAVMSASKKLSWKLIKNCLNSKKVELAKTEDVFELTKCITGAVPPFGSIFKI
jgi:Ala-tRNA(Pro) deacylase